MTNPLNVGDFIDVTITLSAPVTNLSFRIHDIDKTHGSNNQNFGWDDEVFSRPRASPFVQRHQRDRRRHDGRPVPQQRVR